MPARCRPARRIVTLDILRGFALMGILIMFQAWGFGLWMKVGPAWGLVLALVIFFGVQVPWSLWWLRSHERGPMEAIWARLTYGVARPSAAAKAAAP